MKKHNMSKTTIYRRWTSMKARCYNEKLICYDNYGGRGIAVCDEWKNDFVAFYNWAVNNGFKPELEIDRIDNDGNYEPNNCQWITKKENLSPSKRRKTKTSLFTGIKIEHKKFAPHIYINQKRVRLGAYDTEIEAKLAREYFIEIISGQTTRSKCGSLIMEQQTFEECLKLFFKSMKVRCFNDKANN